MATQDAISPAPEKKEVTRRSFLGYSLWAGLLAVAAEGVAATLASLWPRVKAGGVGSVINAGKAEDFAVGSITYFPDGHFYLSRVEAGFLALNRKCTHLGCVVPWQKDEQTEDRLALKGRFNCPCHGGIYDRYGQVIAGPPPRPLDLNPINIQDGQILVDTGKIILRQSYDASQVAKI